MLERECQVSWGYLCVSVLLLWGTCEDLGVAGVDKNAKCWYIAGKDNKVSGHLNDHKYQVSGTFIRRY